MEQYGIWNNIDNQWLYDKDFNLYVFNNWQVAYMQSDCFELRDKDRLEAHIDQLYVNGLCPDKDYVCYEVREYGK